MGSDHLFMEPRYLDFHPLVCHWPSDFNYSRLDFSSVCKIKANFA